MFWTLTQVALGGAIGSALRYGAVLAIGAPLGVLIVNVLGCFVMGVAFVLLQARLSPLLMAGVLGGFTTFSAFSLDALMLWESGRSLMAAVYVGASVLTSLIAMALGAGLARGVFG